MTAYNVLTLIKHERLPEALQAIKWLASQRNSKGGFKSTQDTMIALQAMTEYTLQITKSDNDLKLKVKAGEDFAYDITEENELVLQSDKLDLNPADLPKITAEVDGQGCFMVQNILRYLKLLEGGINLNIFLSLQTKSCKKFQYRKYLGIIISIVYL